MSERLRIGIQGGPGSFNEEALQKYKDQPKLQDVAIDVRYLHTTDEVLKALHSDNPAQRIDQGLFALHNEWGGIVDESFAAMGKYTFEPVDEVQLHISHTLMVRKDVDFDPDTTKLVTHSQVLAQCRENLEKKYPTLTKLSGDGALVDHALVAEHMARGKTVKAGGEIFKAREIATMGSRRLAEIYDHKIIEENMEDAKRNITSFVVVQRP